MLTMLKRYARSSITKKHTRLTGNPSRVYSSDMTKPRTKKAVSVPQQIPQSSSVPTGEQSSMVAVTEPVKQKTEFPVDEETGCQIVDTRTLVDRAFKSECRTIDDAAVRGMAKLSAKMLTDVEACRLLGLNHRSWIEWKRKNADKFKAAHETFYAVRVDSLLNRIEDSAHGIGLKYPDWRAAKCLLEFQDRQRFGDADRRGGDARVQVTVLADEGASARMLQSIYGVSPAQLPASVQPAIEAGSESVELPTAAPVSYNETSSNETVPQSDTPASQSYTASNTETPVQ